MAGVQNLISLLVCTNEPSCVKALKAEGDSIGEFGQEEGDAIQPVVLTLDSRKVM